MTYFNLIYELVQWAAILGFAVACMSQNRIIRDMDWMIDRLADDTLANAQAMADLKALLNHASEPA